MEAILDTYLQLIKKQCPLVSEKDIAFYANGLTISKLKKGEYYIIANSIQKNVGYIHKGLVRCYYTNDDGKEITFSFEKEGGFLTHYPAFISQEPSKYSFHCLENSVIVNISHKHMINCVEECPTLLFYLSMSLGKGFAIQLNRLENFLFNDAETRYSDFVTNNPDLLNRISLTHLSSFLGIERQSLTRIRKKLSRK